MKVWMLAVAALIFMLLSTEFAFPGSGMSVWLTRVLGLSSVGFAFWMLASIAR